MFGLNRKTLLAIAINAIAFTPVMAAADIQQENTPACINHTVATWGVPRELLLAVHKIEGGKPGIIARNKTSYDMGPMQFNSVTVASLAKYGVTEAHMTYSECASFYVAGWMLANSARKFGDWLLAVASYNCVDGCVDKAIKKRNGMTLTVAELDIPNSTKTYYVPKVYETWQRIATNGE